MVSYRVMLDVPGELVRFVSGLLADHRREIGTRKGTRRLGCYRQALFGLAWFRDRGDIRRLGAGFGLSQSTACRYLAEVIEVLAACAPGLAEQLELALTGGAPYLILDGKVVDTDRCREKTNVLVTAAEGGNSPFRSWPSPPPVSGNAAADCIGVIVDAAEFALWLSPHIIIINIDRILAQLFKWAQPQIDAYLRAIVMAAEHSAAASWLTCPGQSTTAPTTRTT